MEVMTRNRQDVAVARAACCALLPKANSGAASVVSDVGTSAVLDAMKWLSSDLEVVKQACAVLATLAERSSATSIGPRGTVTVLGAMAKHQDSQAVAQHACSLLCTLAGRCKQHREYIADNGGIDVVLGAMRHSTTSECVAASGCRLLYALDRPLDVVLYGGVPVVREVMERHKQRTAVIAPACSLLCCIGVENSGFRKLLVDAGLVPILQQHHQEVGGKNTGGENTLAKCLQSLIGVLVTTQCSHLPWHVDNNAWFTQTWALDDAFDREMKWHRVTPEGNDEHVVFTVALPHTTPLYHWIAGEVSFGGLTLSRVEVVKSATMLKAFQSRLGQVGTQRAQPGGPFNAEFGKEDTVKHAMLEAMKSGLADTSRRHMTVLLAWHGCGEAVVDSIVKGGAVNLAGANDRGYFGSGIYLTRQAPYAAGYSTRRIHGADKWREPNDRGEHVLLLCAVSVRLAYPVSHSKDYAQGSNVCSFYGKKLHGACDTHYVHVSTASGFQATRDPTQFNFEEVVVAQEAQVLPFAKVYVRVDCRQQEDYLFINPPVIQVPQPK